MNNATKGAVFTALYLFNMTKKTPEDLTIHAEISKIALTKRTACLKL